MRALASGQNDQRAAAAISSLRRVEASTTFAISRSSAASASITLRPGARRSAGAGHAVGQPRGALVRPRGEQRRPLDRREREPRRLILGQALRDAGLGQRIDEAEQEGRAAARHRGRRPEHRLVVDPFGEAERRGQRLRLGARGGIGLGVGVEQHHALADRDRRVGHDPHDRAMHREALGQRGHLDAGEHRDDQRPLAAPAARARAPLRRASAASSPAPARRASRHRAAAPCRRTTPPSTGAPDGRITVMRAGSIPAASQPRSIAPPILPAPASQIGPPPARASAAIITPLRASRSAPRRSRRPASCRPTARTGTPDRSARTRRSRFRSASRPDRG